MTKIYIRPILLFNLSFSLSRCPYLLVSSATLVPLPQGQPSLLPSTPLHKTRIKARYTFSLLQLYEFHCCVFVRFHFSSATTRKRAPLFHRFRDCIEIRRFLRLFASLLSLSLSRSFVRSFHGEHDGNLHSFCWVSENVISVLLNGWKERLEERHTLIKLEKLKNVSSFFIRGGMRSNCLKRQAKIWKIAFEIIYWTIVNMHVKWYHLRFKMIDNVNKIWFFL